MFDAIHCIAHAADAPAVAATVAAALRADLVAHAEVTPVAAGSTPATAGVLRVGVAGDGVVEAPADAPAGPWMYAAVDAAGGLLCASAPHLLYSLFTQLRDTWLPRNADLTRGRWLQPRFQALAGHDELLVGRFGFVKRRRAPVTMQDIDTSLAELARLGCSHVVVNELASLSGRERGPAGEIYYRFYDYAPDLDQFVETRFNAGTYPAEFLQANLDLLKDLARRADRYGLIPGFYAAHPRSVPESLLRRYPFLRGARIDHTFRAYEPRYTLTVAHPAVRWHYAELIRTLLREVPQLGFLKTLLNDSGAGFEHTASLYPGRNGGPYIVREWRPDEEIAARAADNVIRYWRGLRDAARQVRPDFVLVAGLKNIAEEQGPIFAGMDTGIDLMAESQRGDVADPDWDAALAGLRSRGSQAWASTYAKGSQYLLGVPCPWVTARRLGDLARAGFDHVDVYVDAAHLAPFDPNRDVVRACQTVETATPTATDQAAAAAAIDAVVQQRARRLVGDGADALMAAWRASDAAVAALPETSQYAWLGFTWYRFWARPFVPDMSAVPEADRVPYEEYMLTTFNNPHNIDFGADALWEILSVARCDELLERFEPLWPLLAAAVERAAAGARANGGSAGGADVWVDLRDRLQAFACYAETLRNICGWIAGVRGYLEATDDAERERRRALALDTCARELANARQLLALWERSDVDFMPLLARGETTHHYGLNLGDLQRHRIALMERYGDREPAIDPDYMWRMPPGSPITQQDYRGY